MRRFTGGLLTFSMLLSAATTSAGVVGGPYQDVKVELPPTGDGYTIVIETEYPSLFPPSWKKDKITITINFPGMPNTLAVKGLAYESYDDPGNTSEARITTLYGLDLDPTGTSLAITGFSAGLAAVLEFSDEQFLGNSGAVYHGVSLGAPQLSELPALLPGADLSPFQGDSSSIVFAFQTVVPNSDFTNVPESSSLALAGIGLLCLGATARMHRRRRAEAAS